MDRLKELDAPSRILEIVDKLSTTLDELNEIRDELKQSPYPELEDDLCRIENISLAIQGSVWKAFGKSHEEEQ